MSEKDILNLLSRLGSKGYSATDLGTGHAEIEVTSAQAEKLQEMLGKDHIAFAGFDSGHVLIQVSISKLKDAAETNKKVSTTPASKIRIDVQMVYHLPNAENGVSSAWWESAKKKGGIIIDGQEYPAFSGKAGEYFHAPKRDEQAAKNWDPERLVYVVELPTAKGFETLASYGFKNLLYKVCGADLAEDESEESEE
jgi:hypothetical protein